MNKIEKENYTCIARATKIKLKSVSPHPLSKNKSESFFLNIWSPVEYTGERRLAVRKELQKIYG